MHFGPRNRIIFARNFKCQRDASYNILHSINDKNANQSTELTGVFVEYIRAHADIKRLSIIHPYKDINIRLTSFANQFFQRGA